MLECLVSILADILIDLQIEMEWVDESLTARGLTEALKNDHHFEQAGFVKLLES